MSRKRQSRTVKARRKQEAVFAQVENERVKEKTQRRVNAICLSLMSLLLIGGPLIVVVVSHQTGGHIHMPIGLLLFDFLLLTATIWAIYDWLK